MNEKFFSLSEEKQQKILNSAMEVFALNDYKRASTDVIAAKAGVSKGLLFYYFHNKKELYLYLYEYVAEVMRKQIVNQHFAEITDFYELLEYSSTEKARIMEKNPYILDFALKAFYSDKEDVSEKLQKHNAYQIDNAYMVYFKNLDLSKFREGVDVVKVYKMLLWMADGYMHNLQMNGEAIKVDALKKEFDSWMEMMKQFTYKPEYQ